LLHMANSLPLERCRRKASPRVLLIVLLSGFLSTALLHRYVVALYVIEGSSMAPTLRDGDTALVNMLVRRVVRLDRGEIVLVNDGRYPEYATKRIVGLPGERICFTNGQTYVDDKLLREKYLGEGTVTQSERATFTLGAEEYFVMGDNRADSYDSRIYGPVPRAAIVGSYSRAFWACR
jgi:signal peptidase I